jgi:GNAT superfamily N-acetyltransferase
MRRLSGTISRGGTEMTTTDARPGLDITIHPLSEANLASADDIMRRAFGTFLGMPDPASFMQTADYVRTRWAADPSAAFAATVKGELAGSNFAACWGSVGFFGPLTVSPHLWDQGVGGRLMDPVMERIDAWGCRHVGLFTFPHSPKHVELYRRFGFWPRSLTAVMRRRVLLGTAATGGCETLRSLPDGQQADALAACRAVADEVFAGLDLGREIAAVGSLGLGETVLLGAPDALDGFAVCHLGAGTEAGEGVCKVKFGAVRSGAGAADRFTRLLDACEALAAQRGLPHVDAGVNFARVGAYRLLAERGYRTWLQGVAMHRPNEPGYSHAAAWVIDDWR